MAKKATESAARPLAQSVELLPVSDFTPHGSNPRQGDIGAVCESIARNGWYGAVLAYVSEAGVLTIIVGEHRWRALMELQRHGIDLDGRHHSYAALSATVPLPVIGRVPVIVRRDLSDEQAVRIMLADNRTADLADYSVDVLSELLRQAAASEAGLSGTGWDGEALDALMEGMQNSAAPTNGSDSPYTNKIKLPIYEPKGEMPAVSALIDRQKTDSLVGEIDAAELPDEVASFLRYAAERHTVFNFRQIAEFYCHTGAVTQDLMERSGLVIIDFKKAIEYGFVHLTEQLGALADQEEADDGDA